MSDVSGEVIPEEGGMIGKIPAGIYVVMRSDMYDWARLCTVVYVISSNLKSDLIIRIGSHYSEARIGEYDQMFLYVLRLLLQHSELSEDW